MKYVVFSASGAGGVPDVKKTVEPTAPRWLAEDVMRSELVLALFTCSDAEPVLSAVLGVEHSLQLR